MLVYNWHYFILYFTLLNEKGVYYIRLQFFMIIGRAEQAVYYYNTVTHHVKFLLPFFTLFLSLHTPTYTALTGFARRTWFIPLPVERSARVHVAKQFVVGEWWCVAINIDDRAPRPMIIVRSRPVQGYSHENEYDINYILYTKCMCFFFNSFIVTHVTREIFFKQPW